MEDRLAASGQAAGAGKLSEQISGHVSGCTPHDDPATDAAIIPYISTFVPKLPGANFNPHVSTGVAPREYLNKMLAEPFEPFTFPPAGVAVYQLGPFGTAAKKLKEWDLEPDGNVRPDRKVSETSRQATISSRHVSFSFVATPLPCQVQLD